MIKSYNDVCGLTSDGPTETAITQCKDKPLELYAITLNSPNALSSDPTVVDSIPGAKDYLWSTGPQSIRLGIGNFHGKPSYLGILLNKHLPTTQISTLQVTDSIFDKVLGSFTFNK